MSVTRDPAFSSQTCASLARAGCAALALLAAIVAGCSGSSDSVTGTAGAAGGAVAGAAARGGTTGSGGAMTGSGGATTGSGGATAGSGGATAGSGGATAGSGGSHSTGGASTGGACSQITTLEACHARGDCNAIFHILQCPGSGAPCPNVFAYCSSTGCGPECTAGDICVSQQDVGGATIDTNDAGACPDGTHASAIAGRCDRDPFYACATIPPACGGTATCACAASLCQGACQSVSGGQIDCVEAVP